MNKMTMEEREAYREQQRLEKIAEKEAKKQEQKKLRESEILKKKEELKKVSVVSCTWRHMCKTGCFFTCDVFAD